MTKLTNEEKRRREDDYNDAARTARNTFGPAYPAAHRAAVRAAGRLDAASRRDFARNAAALSAAGKALVNAIHKVPRKK